MNETPCFVGIDVSKESLEVALRPSGKQQRFSNDEEASPVWCSSFAWRLRP